MMAHRSLTDALLFQLGWLACVAGGNRWAALAVALLLPLHLRLLGRSRQEWCLVVAFTSAGLAIDLGWQHFGLLQFRGTLGFGPPPWLAVLWLMFAGTLFHSLAFLQRRLLLASLLGALAGPLTYVAGMRLGAATSDHPWPLVALSMAPAWGLLLPLLARVARSAPAHYAGRDPPAAACCGAGS
jgi:hypothetical protein